MEQPHLHGGGRRSSVLAAVLVAACGRSTEPTRPRGESATAGATTVVRRGVIVAYAEGVGAVRPRREGRVASQLEATILALNADVGDTVRAGAVLVSLDCRLR